MDNSNTGNVWMFGYRKKDDEVEDSERDVEVSDKITGNYLQVIDCYGYPDCPTYKDAFLDKDFLYNLKNFNKELRDKYAYLEISFQPVQKIGFFEGDLNFVLDDDEKMLNQSVEINGEKKSVTTLKTITMDRTIAEILNSNVEKGRGFKEIDYTRVETTIPVLLGNAYKEYYELGDELELNYLSLDVIFEVIGFYNLGTNISVSNQEIILDNYICMPAFDDSTNIAASNEMFQKLYGIQKSKGYVLVSEECSAESIESYREDIKAMSKKNKVYFDFATLRTELLIE